MTKTYTAFVFARGGSKGVKNKNIRPVAGEALIARTIRIALSSQMISKVIVSTDCDDIAAVARQAGASILKRPAELASDTSPEILSWRHAIDQADDWTNLTGEAVKDDAFIVLPTTSPMRSVEDIDAALTLFEQGNLDIVMGVTPSHRNPWLNQVTCSDDDGTIKLVMADSPAYRRQDAPSVFDITTAVYVTTPGYLDRCDKLIDGKVGHVIIPAERSLDIDTEFDLHVADLLARSPFTPKDSLND